MTSTRFLLIGGALLIIVGIVGFLKPDLAGDFLNFDRVENWSHLIAGVLALAVGVMPVDEPKKWTALAIGMAAIVIAILGFIVKGNPVPNLYGVTNLEDPVENILHLAFGLWAVVAAFGKNGRAA